MRRIGLTLIPQLLLVQPSPSHRFDLILDALEKLRGVPIANWSVRSRVYIPEIVAEREVTIVR